MESPLRVFQTTPTESGGLTTPPYPHSSLLLCWGGGGDQLQTCNPDPLEQNCPRNIIRSFHLQPLIILSSSAYSSPPSGNNGVQAKVQIFHIISIRFRYMRWCWREWRETPSAVHWLNLKEVRHTTQHKSTAGCCNFQIWSHLQRRTNWSGLALMGVGMKGRRRRGEERRDDSTK